MDFETESTGECVDFDKLFLTSLSACTMSYSGNTCKLQCDIKICVLLATVSFYIMS